MQYSLRLPCPFIGPKIVLVPKLYWSKNCIGPKIYWSKNVLVQKCIGPKLYWSRIVMVQNCIAPKLYWSKNVLLQNCIGPKLFRHTKCSQIFWGCPKSFVKFLGDWQKLVDDSIAKFSGEKSFGALNSKALNI